MDLRQNSGAALPIVLVFSAFAFIVAVLYVTGQYTVARPFLAAPTSFQALCNARSGVWKGIELMSRPVPDTLAAIKTLDSTFNKNLFGKPPATVSGNNSSGLAPDDTPLVVTPLTSDSFGDASISLSYLSCFKVITSHGRFRTAEKTVRVLLGGALYTSADTVCYLMTGIDPVGGNITGKKSIASLDTASFHTKDLTDLVSYYSTLLSEKSDTTMPAVPVTVQSGDQARALPEVVKGHLFVNGVFGNLTWKEKRRIIVLGDIQVTGNPMIEGIEFVSMGEVKFFDDCKLRNVSVFATGRLTIGDRAVFSGTSLTPTVLIYKDGRVEDKSMIVSYGVNPAKKAIVVPTSIVLSQNASVDGVIIAYGSPGVITTEKGVVVRGIMWAQGSVVHQGALYGVLRARDLADLATLTTSAGGRAGAAPVLVKNTLTGAIMPLPEITSYPCPFFLGRPSIIRWEEE